MTWQQSFPWILDLQRKLHPDVSHTDLRLDDRGKSLFRDAEKYMARLRGPNGIHSYGDRAVGAILEAHRRRKPRGCGAHVLQSRFSLADGKPYRALCDIATLSFWLLWLPKIRCPR